MTRPQIRLEALRLCHRHDRTAEENVQVAKILEAYIAGESVEQEIETAKDEPQETKRPRGRPAGKKTDNATLFD